MSEEYRNQINEIRENCYKKYFGLYSALIVWKDPICKGKVSHRSIASDEYIEAETWIRCATEQYTKYDFPYIAYLNGEQYNVFGEW